MDKTKEQTYTTTLSSRGQVVLPAPVRRKLRLRKGARLHITVPEHVQDGLILRPVQPRSLAALCGMFPGAGKALEVLEEQRKKDRGRGK